MALYIGNQRVAPTIVTTPLGIPLEVSSNGKLQKPISSFTWSLPSNVTDVKEYALQYAFSYCTGLTSADLSSLTTISGSVALFNAFSYCTNLASVNLSNLTTISGNGVFFFAFRECSKLTNVVFSSLTTISNTGALNQAFTSCDKLENLSFPSLTSNAFGSYTDQFNNMLSDVTGCTVHFPSNLQSVIGNWSSVTSGFGGTNTTVLFDLPATT